MILSLTVRSSAAAWVHLQPFETTPALAKLRVVGGTERGWRGDGALALNCQHEERQRVGQRQQRTLRYDFEQPWR